MSDRYKQGDEFKCTLVITSVDEDTDKTLYQLKVKELDTYLDDCQYTEELDEAFNPAVIHAKLLKQQEEIAAKLAAMEGV